MVKPRFEIVEFRRLTVQIGLSSAYTYRETYSIGLDFDIASCQT